MASSLSKCFDLPEMAFGCIWTGLPHHGSALEEEVWRGAEDHSQAQDGEEGGAEEPGVPFLWAFSGVWG